MAMTATIFNEHEACCKDGGWLWTRRVRVQSVVMAVLSVVGQNRPDHIDIRGPQP